MILLSPLFWYSIYNSGAFPAEQPQSDGFFMAWGAMALMLGALIVVGVSFWRAFNGQAPKRIPRLAELAIPLLSVIGFGVAVYLTYVETTSALAICGPVGDCNAVQNSSYAILFGFLPVGLLGAIGYVAILGAWLWRRFRRDRLAELAAPAIFIMTLFGTLFSIYLTYLELFVIRAVCIWCVSSAVIITLQMLLSSGAGAAWLAVSEEE